jgi:hypothetical protein
VERPAHTDSDISVAFVEADILHTGDTYWIGTYPFIVYSTGGTSTARSVPPTRIWLPRQKAGRGRSPDHRSVALPPGRAGLST